VAVGGHRQAQKAREPDLSGGGRRQVAAAHHARHAVRPVVHHARQQVGHRAVASPHHRIAELRRRILGEVLPALVAQLETSVGQAHPQHLVGGAPAAFGKRTLAAEVGVPEAAVGCAGPDGANARATARAGVEPPRPFERVEGGRVACARPALNVHRVPLEPQPGERRLHRCGPLGPTAVGVEVFEAQAHARAPRTRVEPAQERGQQRAGMGGPRGGRGKPPHLPVRRHSGRVRCTPTRGSAQARPP
jgi:hypothetical protein